MPPGAAGPPGPGRPNLWRQATSTTGGTIAVIVAACLVALLVLGMAGAAVFFGARVVAANHREERMEQMRERLADQLPPGQRKKLDEQVPAPKLPDGRGNGRGDGQGNGLGPMMRGAMGLGDLQHGQFTVSAADGKATVMTVQRGTVTAASGTSVTVKSDDGFTATYAVDDSTRGRSGAVAKGDTVLVVAQKDGAKAVMIRPTRAG